MTLTMTPVDADADQQTKEKAPVHDGEQLWLRDGLEGVDSDGRDGCKLLLVDAEGDRLGAAAYARNHIGRAHAEAGKHGVRDGALVDVGARLFAFAHGGPSVIKHVA